MSIVGIPRESARALVAVTPEGVDRLTALGFTCLVEEGAGERAGFAYSSTVSRQELWERADIVLTLDPATWPAPRPGTVLVGLLGESRPAGVDAFALERLPRISRAQSMDVLSTLGTAAGYRAALLATERCSRFFPMLTTAAGTVPPARVLVLGAGVAGLMAMATARRLGAVVTGYDIRPAAQDEIRSVGALVLTPPEVERPECDQMHACEQPEEVISRQQEGLARAVAASHVVIGTASVPGRPAPVLVTRAMVESMQPGAVVVDLALGNCELTRAGEVYLHRGVHLLGLRDLPSQLPYSCSQMLARNLAAYLSLLAPGGTLKIPWEDELVSACCVSRKESHATRPEHPLPGNDPGASADPIGLSANLQP